MTGPGCPDLASTARRPALTLSTYKYDAARWAGCPWNRGHVTPHTHSILRLLVILACLALLIGPAVGASGAPSAPTHQSVPWEWPLANIPPVLRHFDRPPEKWMAGHRGVDLGAAQDLEVVSPSDGKVAFVGTVVDRPVLTIDHGDGLLSSFEPVTASVTVGERVREGQVIGRLSSEVHCPGPCLHWGVREDGEYVNPLNFVSDRRPSVLLPLHGPS
ncbi:peptidoglycan DD-metalloendopeptidase family protein [Arthrobacter sp. JZ12]|uniref:M23 family metallopeptidase n=1 Tax=Arthrobacter sp. JZ12 TaxID=2654190 RepID=UPI002B46E1FC|nr:M23 family metallopeptidase [Arthrobacter sp. JZ12]WRH24567.1 peptidoglycan DD-metalloendopeptidase family protein [Arthrobacter sp. JZ12]